jgi:hypothetical protein
VRRLAWGEELDHEHIAALLAAMVEANNINGKLSRYVTVRRDWRAYIRSGQLQQQRLEALQRGGQPH